MFSQVQGHLKDVSSLSASAGAFAALKVNGQVITWGQEDFGGDSSKVGSPGAMGSLNIWKAQNAQWPWKALDEVYSKFQIKICDIQYKHIK